MSEIKNMPKVETENVSKGAQRARFFAQYQDGEDLGDILQHIADIRVNHEMERGFDVSKITDFYQVKDHIICKLVNAEMKAD